MRQTLRVHGHVEHRPNGPDPISAAYAIKLFWDDEAVSTGTAFVWTCPKDVAHTRLRDLEVMLSTPGSSVTTLQIVNLSQGDVELLSTPAEVDSGDYHSDDSTPLLVIDDTGDPPANRVNWKDRLAFVVETAGSGAMGLAVEVKFGPNRIRLTP